MMSACPAGFADDEKPELEASEPVKLLRESQLKPGPMLEERAQLVKRIDGLAAKGIGVKPFEELLVQIEEKVGSEPDQLGTDIQYLNEKLSDQEKLNRTANQTTIRGATNLGPNRKMSAREQSKARDILRLCDLWDSRLVAWRKEDRDVLKLLATVAMIRSWVRQPEKFAYAEATLHSFDALLVNPPPRLH